MHSVSCERQIRHLLYSQNWKWSIALLIMDVVPIHGQLCFCFLATENSSFITRKKVRESENYNFKFMQFQHNNFGLFNFLYQVTPAFPGILACILLSKATKSAIVFLNPSTNFLKSIFEERKSPSKRRTLDNAVYIHPLVPYSQLFVI
jgi:hypothetical protein